MERIEREIVKYTSLFHGKLDFGWDRLGAAKSWLSYPTTLNYRNAEHRGHSPAFRISIVLGKLYQGKGEGQTLPLLGRKNSTNVLKNICRGLNTVF